MGLTKLSVKQSTITCYKCGITFGVPMQWGEIRQEDGATFWCPNGHSQAFCDSEVAKLTEQLEREKKRCEWAESNRDAAERSAAAYRGHLTRTKKRIGKGVCPCCNRTFQNLTRHMSSEHPDYAD